jgi:hypothetical protein
VLYIMDLAIRDTIIEKLRAEIKKNQSEVMVQLRDIEVIQGDNKFLSAVFDDYKRYKEYIVGEKEREKEQMEMLVRYLEKILEEINLTEDMRRRALWEQNRILGQLDGVKKELDDLVSE